MHLRWTLAVQTGGRPSGILQATEWEAKIMSFAHRRTSCHPTQTIVVEGGSIDGLYDAEPVDLFDAWLFAEAECALTLQGWCAAGVEEKAAAHAAYSAALDREEHAARILCDRLRHAQLPAGGA
jgi:hypothetical protein